MIATLALVAVPAVQNGSIDLLATFTEGLLSFGWPCLLPLVPGYLSFISGVSAVGIVSRSLPSSTITTTNAVKSIRPAALPSDRNHQRNSAFNIIVGILIITNNLSELTRTLGRLQS